MSLPYEGDSANQNVPGISGKNSAGGIGVSGQSTGGVAGFFDGEVAVTRNITAQDILLAGAQPPVQGLVAQLQALTKRIQDLESQVLPVGCIVAFAGSFTGLREWRLCDGKSVSKDAFPELFDAIGTNWGGDGNPNFNLPDLRGLFLRGVDGGSGIDKDIVSRTAIKTGGSTQASVGSFQTDDFREHNHQPSAITENNRIFWSAPRPGAEWKSGFAGGDAFADSGALGVSRNSMTVIVTEQNRGGKETRPVNAAVNYIVRVK
jgi:microcystin-dependent protein